MEGANESFEWSKVGKALKGEREGLLASLTVDFSIQCFKSRNKKKQFYMSHENALDAVLKKSVEMPKDAIQVKGYDFNQGVNYEELLKSFLTTGYQATHLGQAIEITKEMIQWRLSDEPLDQQQGENPEQVKTKIFLGYTSNLVSAGIRESIRYLVEHKRVDCVVSSAGGVEEDFIKCLGPTYVASFNLDGASLRKQGLNRIGNLLVPNDNYCKFEDWLMPILGEMLKEQQQGELWTPSKIIHRLGKEINHPESIYYWAYKNDIPVFCPALTDGSLGDMIYFFNVRNSPGLIVDIASDIRKINDQAVFAKKTGMIILGGGVIKHHICNANLMVISFDVA